MANKNRSASSLGKLARAKRTFADVFVIADPAIQSLLDDRAVAILEAAELEHSLEYAIWMRLDPLTDDLKKELFEGDSAPLGTFAAKTKVAQALKLIGPETRRDLDLIRRVRNVFAHSPRMISFSTEEVSSACGSIRAPSKANHPKNLFYPAELPWPPVDARRQFLCAVQILATSLIFAHVDDKPEDMEVIPLG